MLWWLLILGFNSQNKIKDNDGFYDVIKKPHGYIWHFLVICPIIGTDQNKLI